MNSAFENVGMASNFACAELPGFVERQNAASFSRSPIVSLFGPHDKTRDFASLRLRMAVG